MQLPTESTAQEETGLLAPLMIPLFYFYELDNTVVFCLYFAPLDLYFMSLAS